MSGVLSAELGDPLYFPPVRAVKRKANITLTKGLINALTGAPEDVRLSMETIKNLEKISYDIIREAGFRGLSVRPLAVWEKNCSSLVIVAKKDGKNLATGVFTARRGSIAVASPCLIPHVITGSKVIKRFCSVAREPDVKPEEVLRVMFKENPFVNVGDYLFTTPVTQPVVFSLGVSLKSGGVVRAPDSLIGVDVAGVYDSPGVLTVGFVMRPLPTPVFTNVSRYTVTFTPERLRDKRVFALAVGGGLFKKVQSGSVTVSASRVWKDCEPLVFGDYAFCPVVRGEKRVISFRTFLRDGDVSTFGHYDGRIIELRPSVKTFKVGVMSSGDKTFIPIVFEEKAIKGYLVDAETMTVNRAVIPLR